MKPVGNTRVVELSTILAGLMIARVLAEWGIDVVKVESVSDDAWRKQVDTTLSLRTKDANPSFNVQDMNKRSVNLSPRTEAGRGAMMKLSSGVDIFVTSYRVQALKPMGLVYEQLKETFPRLIYASISGYSSEGPESSCPGYDYTVFSARTGLMADLASAGGPSLIPMGGIGDYSVIVALSGGIAAAPYRRPATGEGSKVDVSLLQASTFINCTGIPNGFNGCKLPRDHYDCGHAGSSTYQSSDGEWFYLVIIDYRRFPEFYQMIGIPETAADPRLSISDVYYENRGELAKILDKKLAGQPVSYWHKLLDAHDPPHEVLHHFKDVPYDPQVQANHCTYFHECSDGTKTVFPNGPIHFESVGPPTISCRISGSISRDTDEILKEIGYTDEQVRAMYQLKEIKQLSERRFGAYVYTGNRYRFYLQ